MIAKALPPRRRMTLQGWLEMPEGPPYYELEDGRLIEMPSPGIGHQRIVGLLFGTLNDFVEEKNLGTVAMAVDVALPTGKGYIPDIAFVRKDREARLLAPDGKVHGTPDLVVEVLSPGGGLREHFRKARTFAEADVPWYWLIDSETLGIEEFQHTPNGYLWGTRAGPGEIFEPQALQGLRIKLPGFKRVQAKRRQSKKRP